MLCLSGLYDVSQHYKNQYRHTLHGRKDIHTVQNFRHKLFKVACICKTCLSSILTTQILPRDWWELFWIIVLAVDITDIAKSSRQSLEKVIEITLLPRFEQNLAWEDLNHTRKMVYCRAVIRQLLTMFLAIYVRSAVCPCSQYPVTLKMSKWRSICKNSQHVINQ